MVRVDEISEVDEYQNFLNKNLEEKLKASTELLIKFYSKRLELKYSLFSEKSIYEFNKRNNKYIKDKYLDKIISNLSDKAIDMHAKQRHLGAPFLKEDFNTQKEKIEKGIKENLYLLGETKKILKRINELKQTSYNHRILKNIFPYFVRVQKLESFYLDINKKLLK